MIVEDGTGVVGAKSYASEAALDAYVEATGETQPAGDAEQALVRATAYIDATWGPFYIGFRQSYTQGLLWPRIRGYLVDDVFYATYTEAVATGVDPGDIEFAEIEDSLGREIPDLPPELVRAVCKLALAALSGALNAQMANAGIVTQSREKLGPIEEEKSYAGGIVTPTLRTEIDSILAPLLNGSQPGAVTPTWFWR